MTREFEVTDMRVALVVEVDENLGISSTGVSYCPLLQDGTDLTDYIGAVTIDQEDLSQDEKRQLVLIISAVSGLAPPSENITLGGGKSDMVQYRPRTIRIMGEASRKTTLRIDAVWEKRYGMRRHNIFAEMSSVPSWSENLWDKLGGEDQKISGALFSRAIAVAFSHYEDIINVPKVQLKEITPRIEVLISYKKKEFWFADWLFHYIGKNWGRYFIPTLDEYEIMPSNILPKGLSRLIKDAGCAIMLYSKDYAQAKGWAGREMESLIARLARDEIKLGILLIGAEENDLNELLKPVRREDLRSLNQTSFSAMETEIRKVIDKLMRGFMGLSDNPYR